MPVVEKIDLKWNKAVLGQMDQRAIEGLYAMGYDMANQARINAPVLTGALMNSIRVESDGERAIKVIAGGMAVKGRVINYAWKREQGPNRDPSTEHYMENAEKAIMTGDWAKKYFGKVTQ